LSQPFSLLRKEEMAVAALLVVAACAAPFVHERSRMEDDVMTVELQELDARRAELRQLRQVGDCRDVCRLSSLICASRGRICAIAARHPDTDDYAASCRSATRDCESAGARCAQCESSGVEGGSPGTSPGTFGPERY
jgi:hypothetical protein